jgi:hypothetical protein
MCIKSLLQLSIQSLAGGGAQARAVCQCQGAPLEASSSAGSRERDPRTEPVLGPSAVGPPGGRPHRAADRARRPSGDLEQDAVPGEHGRGGEDRWARATTSSSAALGHHDSPLNRPSMSSSSCPDDALLCSAPNQSPAPAV